MFSILCEFLSYGKKFSDQECSPILIGSFGFPEHISWENFFPILKKLSSTWETIMRSYLPCRGRGMNDQVPLDLQWFIQVLQILCFRSRLSFQNSKPLIVRKNHMWDPFSHRRGRYGVIGCIPIFIGSFPFPEYIPCENFLPKLKNSQIKLYIIMEAYLPQS